MSNITNSVRAVGFLAIFYGPFKSEPRAGTARGQYVQACGRSAENAVALLVDDLAALPAPGDTLVFKIELISPIRRGIVHMQGYGYVGENIVVEAELMAQVAKNNIE